MSTPLAGSPPSAAPTAPRAHRRLDLLIGILVGLVLGIGVVAAFVFLGSEGTIDAPRISGVDTGKPSQEAGKPAQGTAPAQGAKPEDAKTPAGNAAELGTEP